MTSTLAIRCRSYQSFGGGAVAEGHDIFNILRCACINPIIHYHLPLGQLNVGDRMDAVEVDNLQIYPTQTG